jgi:hypothetical protein
MGSTGPFLDGIPRDELGSANEPAGQGDFSGKTASFVCKDKKHGLSDVLGEMRVAGRACRGGDDQAIIVLDQRFQSAVVALQIRGQKLLVVHLNTMACRIGKPTKIWFQIIVGREWELDWVGFGLTGFDWGLQVGGSGRRGSVPTFPGGVLPVNP